MGLLGCIWEIAGLVQWCSVPFLEVLDTCYPPLGVRDHLSE